MFHTNQEKNHMHLVLKHRAKLQNLDVFENYLI